MAIFSVDTIKTSINDKLQLKEHDQDYSDCCYFSESLKYILEEHKKFIMLLSERYKLDPINEGDTLIQNLQYYLSDKIDIPYIVENMYNSFINTISKLWDDFSINVINRYNPSYKQHKDGYNYINSGIFTIYTSFKNELFKELSTLIRDLSKFRDFTSYEELIKELDIISANIYSSNPDTHFDQLRGNILGLSTPVKEDEFAGHLFYYYRNNNDTSNLKSIDNIFKELELEKNSMELSMSELVSKIKDIDFNSYIKDNIPKSTVDILIDITKDKLLRLSKICDTYIMVFSAKLDAVKDCIMVE